MIHETKTLALRTTGGKQLTRLQIREVIEYMEYVLKVGGNKATIGITDTTFGYEFTSVEKSKFWPVQASDVPAEDPSPTEEEGPEPHPSQSSAELHKSETD